MTKPALLLCAGIVLLPLLSGCRKDAGEGGLATVRGTVWGRDLDQDGFLKTEGLLGDQRVFIGAEGEAAHFETTRSSYDGSFEFRGLRKGTYDVWAFSRCDTCALEDTAVLRGVTVDSRKETVTADTLFVNF